MSGLRCKGWAAAGLLCLGAALIAPAGAVTDGTAADASSNNVAGILSGGWLDVAYVDLTNGFSVRPPVGSMIVSNATDTVGDLTQWESLKLPESKSLVGFIQPQTRRQLHLYLLVTRQSYSLDQMQEARVAYWAQSAGQAAPDAVHSETFQDNPAFALEYRLKLGQEQAYYLRETVIQLAKNRYFVLLLLAPTNGEQAPTAERLADAVAGSFKCFTKEQINQRIGQARQQAQALLGSLSSQGVHAALTPVRWFRVFYQDKDAGFLQITEKMQPLPEKRHAFIAHYDAYLQNSQAVGSFLNLMGWRGSAMNLLNQEQAYAGPVRWEAEFSLDGKLNAEQFTAQLTDVKNPARTYCEKGRWENGQVVVEECQAAKPDEEPLSESFPLMAAHEKIYLAGVPNGLLTRFLDKKVGSEYMFVRYLYHNLGYFPLRVSAEVQRKRPAEAGGEAAEAAEAEQANKAYYLVGQLNTTGGILEIWIDGQGQVLRMKSGPVELVRSGRQKIDELWPGLAPQEQPAAPQPVAPVEAGNEPTR